MNRRGFLSFVAAAPVVAPVAAQAALQGAPVRGRLARAFGAARLETELDFSKVRFSPGIVSDLNVADRVQGEIRSFLNGCDGLSLSLDAEPRCPWAPPQVVEVA